MTHVQWLTNSVFLFFYTVSALPLFPCSPCTHVAPRGQRRVWPVIVTGSEGSRHTVGDLPCLCQVTAPPAHPPERVALHAFYRHPKLPSCVSVARLTFIVSVRFLALPFVIRLLPPPQPPPRPHSARALQLQCLPLCHGLPRTLTPGDSTRGDNDQRLK